eukprot:5611633-Pyramimonas_sp.AAC.1
MGCCVADGTDLRKKASANSVLSIALSYDAGALPCHPEGVNFAYRVLENKLAAIKSFDFSTSSGRARHGHCRIDHYNLIKVSRHSRIHLIQFSYQFFMDILSTSPDVK